MKEHVRAALAASALAANSGQKISSIYSFSAGGYRMIDASVNDGRLTGYDYTAGCHFDGNLPSLYHYGEGCHLDLKPNGSGKYSGYDYGSGCHFEITVRGNGAEVYDYGAGGLFSYSR